MRLAELFEAKFRADLRFRGAAYLKADRVAVTRVTSEQVYAVVTEGVEYHTQLSRENGDLKMYCNCEQFARHSVCKHLWATILAVDEGELLTGSAKAGYIPPFVTESEPVWFEDDEFEEETGDVFQPKPRNGRTATPVQTRLRKWEAKLAELRKQMEANEPAAPSAGREREIFYLVDIEESRSAGQFVVQTSQRQRRSNGQWGKLKPLKLRPGRLEEIEHADDSKILAYLSGGLPERSSWHAQQVETQSAVFRYRVPFELCELILPLMCRTGRVRILEKTTALEWDGGPPWDLTVQVVLDESSQQWKLDGLLQRDGQMLSARDAMLLVPGGLVVTETQIARLRDFGAFEWISLVCQHEPLSVSEGEEHELVDYLLDMPALPRLELPDELKLDEVHAEPVPVLTIRSPRGARWHLERLQGEVCFDYLGTLIRGGSSQWAIVQRDQSRCLIRDREREDRAWGQLQECGFRRMLDPRRGGHDVEINARGLGPAVRALMAEGWSVQADGMQVRQPGDVKFRIQSGIDWFELHADIEFDGRSVSFPELLSALARGDTTIRLDDGSLGILPEEWAQQLGLLVGLGVSNEDHVRFSSQQVALLDALLAAQTVVDCDERYRQLREKMQSFAGIDAEREREEFRGELREYQREGLGWLSFLNEFHFGGCLADDMGLGKTIQMLALLLKRKKTRKKKMPSLVVVPKSLMFNWVQEAARFTPELKVLDYTGLDRSRLRDHFAKHDIVLTTYGTLRRDIIDLKEVQFDYAILDEAQTIKNASSQVAKASRLIQANNRVALSGTPIENHLGDLWSIFEFLNPGMLGRSSLFQSFSANAKDIESRRLLAHGLKPFILRRTKRQVASELPEKNEQTIYCDMGETQQELYQELKDHYRASLLGLVKRQGLAKSKMHVLEALLRLRQAACHPGLLAEERVEETSAKLDVLCPHLEELIEEGHKALVFSQFTSMLSIVRQHLEKHNIVYEYLDGQTRKRKERVERFQSDPDCGAFLISLKAGGLGLNLTAADYVFILDPWWNPAVEAQAIDRAHRVGQTRQVFAYRLICRGTVEEKIAELQTQKRELADAILQADGNLMRDLSTEDLEMLLS